MPFTVALLAALFIFAGREVTVGNGSPISGEANLRERDSNWYFSRELPETGTCRIIPATAAATG
jgi:hypothetical protein